MFDVSLFFQQRGSELLKLGLSVEQVLSWSDLSVVYLIIILVGKFQKSGDQKSNKIKIEITLWHGCSPVNLLHIFRITFPNNTSGGLLLRDLLTNKLSLFSIARIKSPITRKFLIAFVYVFYVIFMCVS